MHKLIQSLIPFPQHFISLKKGSLNSIYWALKKLKHIYLFAYFIEIEYQNINWSLKRGSFDSMTLIKVCSLKLQICCQ